MMNSALTFLVGVLLAAALRAGEASVPGAVPSLSVLSLNLMQKGIAPRRQRLARVAQFVTAQHVDALLLQEGSGGLWDRTVNSLSDLAAMLKDCGGLYVHRSRPSVGVRGVLVFRVGVMTRYPIQWVEARRLGHPNGDWFDRWPLPGRRNAVAVGMELPGLGRVTLVSVHFFSGGDKEKQAEALVAFVQELAVHHPGAATVLGGDFNMGRASAGYRRITAAGFTELTASTGSTIDFIFASGRVRATSAALAFAANEVSDHPGIVATVVPTVEE
jgi:endonuclease/exonuclease/phosphatase family metal-dependent hydrolase